MGKDGWERVARVAEFTEFGFQLKSPKIVHVVEEKTKFLRILASSLSKNIQDCPDYGTRTMISNTDDGFMFFSGCGI